MFQESNTKYIGEQHLNIMSLATHYNNWIFNWVSTDLPDQSKILDFGAGMGQFINRFSNMVVYAVELDQAFHHNIHATTTTDIAQIPENLDLIYALNVLEHIENDDEIFKSFYQHLQASGAIRILVPARPELFCAMDTHVGHFRRYTPRQLRELCTRNGFIIQSLRYFDFLGYFITLLYKWFDNSGAINTSALLFYDRYIFPISILLDRLTFGKIIGKNLLLIAKKK